MALALVAGMLGVQLVVVAVLLEVLARELGRIADQLEAVIQRAKLSAD